MTILQLNKLLARELGRVQLSDDGIYKWEWSETLFWPNCRTGKMVECASPGGIIYFQPEFKSARMTRKREVWGVTKWLSTEAFLKATDKMCVSELNPGLCLEAWDRRFPGADYPVNGLCIPTDWWNYPGIQPGYEDTLDCIKCAKESQAMNFAPRLSEMQDDFDRKENSGDSELRAEVRDSFTAFLNEPGKRGNSVSMPWTKEDRI